MKKESYTIRGRLSPAAAPCDIEIVGGRVARVGRAGKAVADFGSITAIIGPALFDTQVNGAAGYSLQGDRVSPENLARVAEHLASWGVSHWVPTIVTAALEEMEHACRVIAKALENPRLRRAVPGIHLEGPCISPEDGPRGAHPQAHVRPPSMREFDRLYRAAEGRILYTTVAPELPGATAYIRALIRRGVIVSLGHHQGSAKDIAKAVDAGARLSTHLGNGSAPRMHRFENPLWPQLADDRLHASLIADLHHLPPDMLKTLVRAKGRERIILVSDCTRIAGLKAGKYIEFGAEVELKRSGKLCLSGTDLLAGSASMLLEGVVNTWQATDMSLEEAFAAAATVPARFFGVKLPPPTPKPGRKANLVVFHADTSRPRAHVRVDAAFINGVRTG